MDQVRVILKIVWQQRFWVLCCSGTLIALICWMMATNELSAEYEKNSQKIDSKFASMKSLVNKAVLPNDQVNDTDFEQTKLLRAQVQEQWKLLFDRQRDEVLFWPKELGPKFVQYMEGRKFLDNIYPAERDKYRQYIQTRFDGLLAIVQARKSEGREGRASTRSYRGGDDDDEEDGGGGPSYRGTVRGMEEEEENYLVEWFDQDNLRTRLHFDSVPDKTDIWVTQEDLWVYETLLNVIANTNKLKGATRPDNTAIKEILALEVGRSAASGNQYSGQIVFPAGSSASAGGRSTHGDDDEDGDGEGGGYRRRSTHGEDDEEGGNGSASLLAYRYIDQEGKPLLGEPEQLGIEFRRLPIRMELTMNQRWVSQVLIECANAALPVEVKQVQINPNESGVGFGGSSGGSRLSRRLDRSRNSQSTDPSVALVEVVIQGVVYIYNEPASNHLIIPGEEEELADASGEPLQR